MPKKFAWNRQSYPEPFFPFMLTRHHVVLGLLCGFIPGSAIAESDPVLAVLIVTGCGIGLILPDIHMKRPKTSMLRSVAWWIVQAGTWICLPVMCRVYRWLLKAACEPGDKRLTHSMPGVFIYFSIFSGIAYVLCLLLKNYIPVPRVMGFLGGLLMGMLLHLAQDLCTRKGITPFYPFDATKIVGSIRPCDVLDNRILRYHMYHGAILFSFLIFLDTAHWTVSELSAVTVLCIGICIASMICPSDVWIEHADNQFPEPGEVISA
jgi:membrane-bound metal-dependent hydrolase YbcI (DUF457 family)